MTHTHTLGEIPVLDIGGDVGALLVYLDETTPSGELEAQPLGRPDARFHTGVHHRMIDGSVTHVALYPEVVHGTYEILDDELRPIATVAVEGAAVAKLDLRLE